MSANPKPEPVFQEIMGSDQIGLYQAFAYNIPQLSAADPSIIWENIRWNPWLAMSVFHDMEEKDDAICSAIETRKVGVLSKTRHMKPASDKRQDRKIAEFVEECLEGYFDQASGEYTGLDQLLYEALDSVGFGVSIGEINFADGGDRVFVRDVRFKPQHLFAFGDTNLAQYSIPSYQLPQTGKLRLRQGVMIDGIGDAGELPENKFLVASYRPRYSNRWGSPLYRKLFWPSYFKRAGVRQWLKNLEKGNGSVVTRYNDGAGDGEKNLALEAARAINEESAVALPRKFSVEVLEQVRQSMGTSYKDLTDDFCNNAITRVILGQTLTSRGSDGGGSRALGDVHQLVRAEKIEADAKFLMMVVNRYLVWPLVIFNFGFVPRPPVWLIDYEPQRDLSAISTWLDRLYRMNVPIPTNFVYNTFSLDKPTEGEDVLKPSDSGQKAGSPATGVDPAADFAEKKTLKLSEISGNQLASKMERFKSLHPTTMKS